VPVKNLLISGEVTIIKGSRGDFVVSPYFNITKNGNPLSGLKINLNNHFLRETAPGQYAGIRITDIIPVVGNQLGFLIEPKKRLEPMTGSVKPSLIRGSATIGSMAQIIQPAPNSEISILDIGKLVPAEWRGGKPAFTIAVVKTTTGSPIEVFSRSGVLTRSFPLKGSIFQSRNTYSVSVAYKMGNFTIETKGKWPGIVIDKASKVSLRYVVMSEIAISGK
jgi:hypothetical protein